MYYFFSRDLPCLNCRFIEMGAMACYEDKERDLLIFPYVYFIQN
jgi:hypothetical protein